MGSADKRRPFICESKPKLLDVDPPNISRVAIDENLGLPTGSDRPIDRIDLGFDLRHVFSGRDWVEKRGYTTTISRLLTTWFDGSAIRVGGAMAS